MPTRPRWRRSAPRRRLPGLQAPLNERIVPGTTILPMRRQGPRTLTRHIAYRQSKEITVRNQRAPRNLRYPPRAERASSGRERAGRRPELRQCKRACGINAIRRGSGTGRADRCRRAAAGQHRVDPSGDDTRNASSWTDRLKAQRARRFISGSSAEPVGVCVAAPPEQRNHGEEPTSAAESAIPPKG